MKKHNMKKTMNPIGTIAVLVGLFGLTQGADSEIVTDVFGQATPEPKTEEVNPEPIPEETPGSEVSGGSVDCQWGEWVIGECSGECGGGIRFKFRVKMQEELFGGNPCDGEDTAIEDCNTGCCPEPCVWGDWELGECSVACGGGTRIDTRTKIFEATCGGQCDPMGPEREEPCNTENCPPIHCVWDEWVIGDCSESCGTGTRINIRTKKVVEKDGGTCTGQPTEEEECQIKECPGCFDVVLTIDGPWGIDISWSVGSCESNQAYPGGHAPTHEIFTQECCLPDGDYIVTCSDSWGDGWAGSFLEINGQKHCEDFPFGDEQQSEVSIGGQSGESPSLAEYEAAKVLLRDFLVDGGLIPVTVRLAFHDCVGPRGCDGCLSDQPDNNGLAGIVSTLTDLRNQEFPTISNADFWQIAGIAALEEANSDVDITFKGGRVDCTSVDDLEHSYPEPSMNRAEMMAWFQGPDGFDMSEEQVTALMGAHSLGRTHTVNSGYNGAWTPEAEFTFDNGFHKLLIDEIRLFSNKANLDADIFDPEKDLKFQWNWPSSGSLGILLNTDVELAYDIDVNTVEGTKCTNSSPDNCEAAATKGLVEEYAKNEPKFLEDFKEAYELMMTAKTNGATLTEPQ